MNMNIALQLQYIHTSLQSYTDITTDQLLCTQDAKPWLQPCCAYDCWWRHDRLAVRPTLEAGNYLLHANKQECSATQNQK